MKVGCKCEIVEGHKGALHGRNVRNVLAAGGHRGSMNATTEARHSADRHCGCLVGGTRTLDRSGNFLDAGQSNVGFDSSHGRVQPVEDT